MQALGSILRYSASAIAVLLALATWALAVVMRSGSPMVTTLLLLPGVWCLGLAWFLLSRKQVFTGTRRWIALALGVSPVCFYLAWTNLWRMERHFKHRDWLTYQSAHFAFHYAPGYPRAGGIAAFARPRDKAFEENSAYLQVSIGGRTDFYLYEQLEEGFAVPRWNVIYADDDQSIGHEMTHIIAYHVAGARQKFRLLDEGISTWLNHSTVEDDHHHAAWTYLRTIGLPPLGEMANSRTFRRHRPPPYYPAASFTGYLIDHYGLAAFRRLWIVGAGYPELYSIAAELKLTEHLPFIPGERAYFESAVLDVYHHPLNELDAEWRTWLDRRYSSSP